MSSSGEAWQTNLDGLFASLKSNSSRPSPNPSVRSPAEGRNSFGFDCTPSSRNSQQPVNASSLGKAQLSAQSNLLDLLKFGPTAAPPQPNTTRKSPPNANAGHESPGSHAFHGRGISTSDLVSSLRSGTSLVSTPIQAAEVTPPNPASHQDSLLKLLNPTTAGAEGAIARASEDRAITPLDDSQVAQDPPVRNSSPIRYFGSKENTPTPFQLETITKASSSQNDSRFTYVNPFEQLAASSPRNSQPLATSNGDSSKRKVKSPLPAAAHSASRRKLTPSGSEVLQSIESEAPDHLKDSSSQLEALVGDGAPNKNTETVKEALKEVGDQVHKQIEDALAEAESQDPQIKQEEQESAGIPSNIIAPEARKELDLPVSPGKNIDEWESAEGDDSGVKDALAREVPVYQFPIKPFVSIEVVKKDSGLSIREESIVNIARFKKDFDQTDRILATATKDFIVYGMPKNGGIRVIQQDNGTSSLLFPNSQDRIFNVAISTANPGASNSGYERVIATGLSGAVYWTTIGEADAEFNRSDMEVQAVIFPPTRAGSDPTSSGQLKTRAKKSSRHPEFFAIGRGKSIQIVFPAHARNSEYFGDASTLDAEKYFADRSLKVTTGKAGKDFAFSEDDTTIVTLDKTGKLRLWDTRDLIAVDNAGASKLAAIEVKTPILTFSTAHSTEKSWPTSVLFVDKIRAYIKGIAQRYIIVGVRQNHTLQLWDLCLGKAVQELSFPHEKETDAVCSLAYHPSSGIIALGHPTRNSIYFIHLSAPRYNLPSMSQAKFVQRLANKDSTLPKAEATAIMSGLREYSLGNIGQLRSLDLAPSVADPSKGAEDEEDRQLFELYVMHSKGVTCLGFKKEDLGWSEDSKALHAVDAEKEGYIIVNDLREPSLPLTSELPSANGDTISPTPSKPSLKALGKDVEKADRAAGTWNTSKNAEKAEKKKAKQNGGAEKVSRQSGASPTAAPNANSTRGDSSLGPQPASSASKEIPRANASKYASNNATDALAAPAGDRSSIPSADEAPISLGISSEFLEKEMKKIEQGVSTEFNRVFHRELEALHQRLDSDKQVQNAATGANQEAILRLVSKQLGDNVEKSLSNIVMNSIKSSVTPSVSQATASSLDKHLPHVLAQQMQHLLPVSLKSALPEAISRSMQAADIHRAISEQVTKSMTGHVEREFASALQSTIIPSFKDLTISTVQKITQNADLRVHDQMQRVETQRRGDSAKIDQLANSVRVLSETIHQMAEAQSEFQTEILRLQQKSAKDSQAVVRRDSLTPSESASMHVTPEQQEIENISVAMQNGRYEDATIMWLQSTQQVPLFDQIFVRCNPSYLHHVSPLVVLSVGAAITGSLENNVKERLAWLETALACVDPNEPDIQKVARKVLDVISQRLQSNYMRIAEDEPTNPMLRQIAALSRRSRELMNLAPYIEE
ncbi:MAG: hypothetical protein Q9163_000599 [Psora crenata]